MVCLQLKYNGRVKWIEKMNGSEKENIGQIKIKATTKIEKMGRL